MPLAPQEIRTFFITAATWGRRSIFRAEPMALLLQDTLQRYRAQHKFLLHEFVLYAESLPSTPDACAHWQPYKPCNSSR